MPMFWSKKPKAEKNYERSAAPAKTVSAKAVAGKAKAVKTGKPAKKEVVVATKSLATVSAGNFGASASAILRPHITEKSGFLSQGGVYTFQVSNTSNKSDIAKAVSTLYKVNPIKVSVLNHPSRKVFIRGRRGTVPGFRKALVTLKKGDKIDFI